ncbi:c-type cytochrome [Halobacteriovorax sp. HLS]|uniref:c-type cytochrome n=1 Tax=Halobacteriovorax sp. HLS TaxID=2234000 RepID=UPI000FDA39CB|nr:c-type cytochrome [Halobacteriovorax sp. HLS]
MTRLVTFGVVLIALVIAISFDKYKNVPVSNEQFDIIKKEASHKAHLQELKELEEKRLALLNPVKEEEAAVEEGPLVVLDTPQLVHGSELYKACVVCHGKKGDGKKSQNAPKIGGQMAWYIEKQLVDMKSEARVNKVMMPYLKKLEGNDFKDLAAYISKLPW